MTKIIGERFVAEAKVRDYLLNAQSADGSSKCNFFTRFGYTREAFEQLSLGLIQHSRDRNIVGKEDTVHGEKSIVECHIATPDGRDPCIRVVWIKLKGESLNRFVTAIPVT